MTRRWMRIGAVAAGSVLAVGMVPTAAQAATTDVKDPRGDAPRVADITKLRVKNGDHRVSGVLTIPNRNKKKLAITELNIKTRDSGRWAYIVSVKRNRQGAVTGKSLGWQRGDDPSSYTPLPCSGIKTSWNGKKTTISVPVRCLTKTTRPRVKVRAAIIARVGEGHDWYDERTRYSRYVKRG
ncbi:hypothetical protein [Mumia sp.]|uniref:hypothetical protein n=1 Tax=Mumia sp. TaxID=1965300 RepID=UPI0026159878|nr:hypothetical protein [Mumia sp.]MDD9349777.1 hypothetical protein [Mumia sp.]